MLAPPPLSLYVHLPWCLRKCPYCDFNSHEARGNVPERRYVGALLRDLEQEVPLVWGRTVQTVFFGGGTPSLFSAAAYERLLSGIRAVVPLSPEAEITLEANPGALEHDRFDAYRDAGINRFSLGVQSFDDAALARLGRIHGRAEIERAVDALHAASISNFNLDVMFALPGQSPEGALADLRAALDCRPAHISRYQLTIEPNTAFHAQPPPLPGDDVAWAMQEAGEALLAEAGFAQYEVSAWSRPGRECLHNLNYWSYGDYLGIGAGAHGKLTLAAGQTIRRRVRLRHPTAWMAAVEGSNLVLAEDRILDPAERLFEFFLNQLRLRAGVDLRQFEARTGLGLAAVRERVAQAVSDGLLNDEGARLKHTQLGWRFGNEVQALFLP